MHSYQHGYECARCSNATNGQQTEFVYNYVLNCLVNELCSMNYAGAAQTNIHG